MKAEFKIYLDDVSKQLIDGPLQTIVENYQSVHTQIEINIKPKHLTVKINTRTISIIRIALYDILVCLDDNRRIEED